MFYNLCMNRLTTLPKNHQHQILTVQFWSIDTFITCNTYVPTSTMQFIWHFINQSKTNYAYLLNTLSKSSLNTTKCTTLWYVQNEIELYIQPYFLLCLSWRIVWQFQSSSWKTCRGRLVESGVKIIVYLDGQQTLNFARSDLAELKQKSFLVSAIM